MKEPPDDGAGVVLQDMRFVHLNDKEHDRTEGHRLARLMQAGNVGAFLAQLTKLEKEHREGKGEERVEEVDHGEGVCLRLVEEWLVGRGVKPSREVVEKEGVVSAVSHLDEMLEG